MFHCLQDIIQNTFQSRGIEIVVEQRQITAVSALKRQSAGDLSGFCHQFGAVPHCFELLGYWELPLWNNQEHNWWNKNWGTALTLLSSWHLRIHLHRAGPGCSSRSSWRWRCRSPASLCSGTPGNRRSCWWRWWGLFPTPADDKHSAALWVCALNEIVANYRSQDATVFLCSVKSFHRTNRKKFVLYTSPTGASQNILRKKEWKCGRIGTNKIQSNHVNSWFLTNLMAQCYTRSSSKQDLHILYHLQLNCLGVDDIHNPHHILKDQAQLLAVVWKETSQIFKLEASRISVKPSFLFYVTHLRWWSWFCP